MTIHEAEQQLHATLFLYYGNREAALITAMVMEKLTGLSRIDRLMSKPVFLSAAQEQLLEQYRIELLALRPVQYVLQEAWFHGMKLYVDERVLIPRPETEELVEWVVREAGGGSSELGVRSSGFRSARVLDIGTGSGCIPLALKKSLPGAEVHGCDTSEGALEVARRNSKALGLDIKLHQIDFLSVAARNALPRFDVLVSNPPYIPLSDKKEMAGHVLNYEPHLALFVEDNDPLVFYRAIADFALARSEKRSTLFVEVHEKLGNAVMELFSHKGAISVKLRQDLQGHDRMVMARF